MLKSVIKNSLSLPALIVGLFAIAILIPHSAAAKTLEFQNETWEVNPNLNHAGVSIPVRNDFKYEALAKNVILGTNSFESTFLLDESTANVINEIAKKINQPARDAKLVIDGRFAKDFDPGQNGQGLDVQALLTLLAANESKITLPVVVSTPTNKLSDTNDLGINELVAVGESDFTGSPKNRIHNITVGANKFNGLIINQGEEFSFNEYLGDVDGEHGFLPELVIKKSGLVAEFGGGLCQVSSTSFRAAMKAGLPITARRNHSFAVKYYAPQGTDATIYPGSQDLKFINNLPSPILVRTRIDGAKLYFEYYGTKDNRIVTLEDPIQYDRKTDGSMKASWSRTVTMANGETSKQTFNSTYQPPALFQKVEQSTTPNPQTTETPNNQPVTTTTTTN